MTIPYGISRWHAGGPRVGRRVLEGDVLPLHGEGQVDPRSRRQDRPRYRSRRSPSVETAGFRREARVVQRDAVVEDTRVEAPISCRRPRMRCPSAARTRRNGCRKTPWLATEQGQNPGPARRRGRFRRLRTRRRAARCRYSDAATIRPVDGLITGLGAS